VTRPPAATPPGRARPRAAPAPIAAARPPATAGGAGNLAAVPAFKAAYLIHGDDHGRVSERRARLRALAESESGSQGVEVLEGEAATPEAVALALSALTFAIGRRFVIVEGVERWKDADLSVLEPVMADMPPDTTVAFFAREEGRAKVPAGLAAAVRKAGGDVAAESNVKPWELPRWLVDQAGRVGLRLEPSAARALVDHVGERQQRLLRELEKIAIELGEGARVGLEEIEAMAAESSERRAWSLADAVIARDQAAATRLLLELRGQGERLPGLLYWLSTRLRLAHDVVARLDSGEAPSDIRRGLRMPPKAADRLIADARRSDRDRLRRSIELLADLELESRGGGTGAGEDTAALTTVLRLAA
jgi:DNA polymerase III subunit delta